MVLYDVQWIDDLSRHLSLCANYTVNLKYFINAKIALHLALEMKNQ